MPRSHTEVLADAKGARESPRPLHLLRRLALHAPPAFRDLGFFGNAAEARRTTEQE